MLTGRKQHQENPAAFQQTIPFLAVPFSSPPSAPPNQQWLIFEQLDLPLLAPGSNQHQCSWARKPQRVHPKPSEVSGNTPTGFRGGCIKPSLKQSHPSFKTFAQHFGARTVYALILLGTCYGACKASTDITAGSLLSAGASDNSLTASLSPPNQRQRLQLHRPASLFSFCGPTATSCRGCCAFCWMGAFNSNRQCVQIFPIPKLFHIFLS